MTKSKSGAFTLIELLVVISITAMLISVLLPVLSTARTAAELTGSMSNTRQIMIAFHTYETDQGSLPWAEDESDTFWSQTLHDAGYVSDWRIFWGPGRALKDGGPTNSSDWQRSGYGVNIYGGVPSFGMRDNSFFAPLPYTPLSLDMPKVSPSEHLILLEMAINPIFPITDFDGWYFVHPGTGHRVFTHNGSAAQGYLDGHAKGDNPLDLGWQAFSQRTGTWVPPLNSQAHTAAEEAPWYSRWN